MTSFIIFGFGLVVTTLIGSALAAMIVLKNRALESEREHREPRSLRPTYAASTSATARESRRDRSTA